MICIGFVVRLFHDVHTVLAYTNLIRQHIQTMILTVEHQFDRTLLRGIGQLQHTAQFKSYSIAEEPHVVVGMGQQHKVLALLHAEGRLLGIKLQTVGLLLKISPRIVATPLYLQWQRVISTPQRAISLQPQGIYIISTFHISLF